MSNKLLAGLGLIAMALTLSACDSSSKAEDQTPPATVRIETIETGPSPFLFPRSVKGFTTRRWSGIRAAWGSWPT